MQLNRKDWILHPQMDRVQIEVLRKMKPEQRLKISMELTEMSKKLLEEGVPNRHPEYTEQEVKLAAKNFARR